MRSQLRPHQERAWNDLRRCIGQGLRRVMLQAPTGMGKTVLAARVVEGARAKGNRVLFIAPAISLIDQTVQMFWREGITETGVIQANHPLTRPDEPIQIASVQTLRKRRLPDADVIVIDEAHVKFKIYETWMRSPKWRGVPVIGLSATPWTKGLGRDYEHLIIGSTTQELIDAGYLSDFRVFAPAHPDLTGVRTVAGDYSKRDLGEAMDQDALVADIVDTWKRRAESRPTFVFAVNRAHAKHLQRLFDAAGVPAGYIDSYTDMLDRAEVKRQFHAGEIKVVCNVGCLTTGVDWDVRCIVLARPTKSEMLFVQMIGRGLRTADGKTDCLILDHSDTHLRLGFVTDIWHDKLDDGEGPRKQERKAKERLPKECPKCAFLKPPKVHQCPSCGFKPEAQSDVEHEDGELVEMRSAKATMEEKQAWFSGLIHIARERGYKDGWAANQYRQKFGVWPNHLAKIPAVPAPDVRSYVTASLIRYAKGREKSTHAG